MLRRVSYVLPLMVTECVTAHSEQQSPRQRSLSGQIGGGGQKNQTEILGFRLDRIFYAAKIKYSSL